MKFWQGIYLMEQGNITVLNENSWGIRLVKTDLKKRSRVDVVNKYGEKLATYRLRSCFQGIIKRLTMVIHKAQLS